MATALERPDGSRTLTMGERVWVNLDEHPEMARRIKQISAATGVNYGTAEREAMIWRNAQRKTSFGPILHQNIHFEARTNRETVPNGSPPGFGGLKWQDRSDGKWMAQMPMLHVEGYAEARIAQTGETAGLVIAVTQGVTSSEAILTFVFFSPLFDSDAVRTLFYETFKDDRNARYDGIQSRTYQDAKGLMLKMYNHEDSRGTMACVEIRSPPVRISYAEVRTFFDGKQPLGRDDKIDALSLQVREETEAILMIRREVKRVLKRFDGGSENGSSVGFGEKAAKARESVHSGFAKRFTSPTPPEPANPPVCP